MGSFPAGRRQAPSSDGLLTGIEQPYRLQNNGTCDLQTVWAELLYGVLWSVPEHVVISIVEINQIRTGDSTLYERRMVIVSGDFAGKKMGLIAECRGGL